MNKGGSKVDDRGLKAFRQFRDLALSEMGFQPTDIGKGALTRLADRLGISVFAMSRLQQRCSLARLCDLLDSWEKAGGAAMALRYMGRQVEVEVVGVASTDR